MKKFKVLKKSAGYSVKGFNTETEARKFAESCCKFNGNDDYVVAVFENGTLVEI